MREHSYFVYILASKIGGTLYIGVTNDLAYRVSQHRLGVGSKFTATHHVTRLVWFEAHDDIETAIRHEKRLKKWKRQWKIALIEQDNPHWIDLFPEIAGSVDTGSPGQAG